MIELLEGEVFKNFNYPDYEHYLVSNKGRVQYKSKLRYLSVDNKGYIKINLSSGNKRKQFFVHRMVAYTFLGNPEGERSFVNHINLDKKDNKLENLEWVTAKENTEHFLSLKPRISKIKKEKYCPPWIDVERLRGQSKMANELACKARRKKVILQNIETGETQNFDSVVELEEKTGLCRKSIGSVCRGERKTHRGYTAKYI